MDEFIRQYGSWLIFGLLFGVMVWAHRRGYGCCAGGHRQQSAAGKEDEQQGPEKGSGHHH